MLKVSLGARIGLLFAAVLLMNAQPEFWESLVIVVGSLPLGSSAALLMPSGGVIRGQRILIREANDR